MSIVFSGFREHRTIEFEGCRTLIGHFTTSVYTEIKHRATCRGFVGKCAFELGVLEHLFSAPARGCVDCSVAHHGDRLGETHQSFSGNLALRNGIDVIDGLCVGSSGTGKDSREK